MFEEYKEKVLKGQIDQQQQVQIDPLWGQGQKPIHYYQNLSKSEIMSVSFSQNKQFSQSIQALYQNFYVSSIEQVPTIEQLNKMGPHQLLNAALFGRNNNVETNQYWYNLQKSFGNKFYDLNIDQLIKLCYCIFGQTKRGSVRLHRIVKDLLESQLPNMNRQQLVQFFYSLQYSKSHGCSLQQKIVSQLSTHYSQMNIQQKINWLFTYATCRKPQTFKKRHQKTLHQLQSKAHQIIFNLNINQDLTKSLNIDLSVKLIYSLAKLRAANTKFITDDLLKYLKQNIQQVTADLQTAYKVFFYLQQVQGGIGINDSELYSALISTLTSAQNFPTLSKIQQIKTIYAIWNYNLLTEQLFELYKSIQIQADSTILHYFNQIQLSRSSQRQWQILRCTAQLNSIPLPYYQSFKRFYNYMRATTEWDLKPIQEKIGNTQYYFDVIRGADRFYSLPIYKNFSKYLKFSGQPSPFEYEIPIDNIEVAQFSYTRYQVSIDVVNQSAFVPGTDTLKQSYRNKIRSLSNIGWKHVVLREKQISKLSASQQFQQILFAYAPYQEQQLQVIANRDYYRSQVIDSLRTADYWDGMIAQEAQGYRNNPEEYAKKIAEQAQKQKKLSEDLAKVQS